MGIETEYGISSPGNRAADPVILSSQVVTAYAAEALSPLGVRTRWDYAEESPLRDARGFDMTRADADPTQLTDEDSGLANVILPNGARLYVDHAHPEFSSPEVSNPLDAVRWDRAGMQVMARGAEIASATTGRPIRLYKNNTDNKGASYGCHENYLMRRDVPFAAIVSVLIPFFVSRQVFAGAGRVGRGQDGRTEGFQLSQRADFFEVEVGLETTLKRPIINTRDEPHADPERFRRLHVIIGDANISESATYLKLGTTALVLAMIEAGVLNDDLMPRKPVASLHQISHDYQLHHVIELRDGTRLTAIEMQEYYCERAAKFMAEQGDTDAQTSDVLARWERTLDALRADPMSLADEVDWVAKLRILEGYRERDGLDWTAPELQLVDLQYSDVRPERGLGARLETGGHLARLTTDEEVRSAEKSPPADTRAYFRGECIRRYGASVAAAGWDSIVFDVPGQAALQRVATPDPFRGTSEQVSKILEASPTAAHLLEALRPSA
jgi:proteasome accessory factor PafA2